ncbi:MAG TPA: phosphate acyltransferase, partial [Brevundimonas sp.]|nr:phosphate acyltransferase [Brevundimonas sp.]HAV48857.1 phosphate acyltransferase [Brevundimonas sp.]
MSKTLVISLDAMGGDHGPSVVVGGVADYLKAHPDSDLRFLVHGDAAAIEAQVRAHRLPADRIDVRHTDKVVAMDEKPAQALRRG